MAVVVMVGRAGAVLVPMLSRPVVGVLLQHVYPTHLGGRLMVKLTFLYSLFVFLLFRPNSGLSALQVEQLIGRKVADSVAWCASWEPKLHILSQQQSCYVKAQEKLEFQPVTPAFQILNDNQVQSCKQLLC